MLITLTRRQITDSVLVRHAIVSVSNKEGLEPFVQALGALTRPISLYSTGGTYRAVASYLEAAGPLDLKAIEAYTGYPEMPGGLVKTLHPRIHGGLLAELDSQAQLAYLQEHGMVTFDLVVVNLYPFQEAIAHPETTLEQARQQIDIGGPTMLRAAAKNFPRMAVLCDPADYAPFVQELAELEGSVSFATRWRLAQKAFRHVLEYDRAIADYLDRMPASEAAKGYDIR